MTIVSSAGEDIYFEVTGDDGPVVVLGHGAGGNHASWFQQVPVLVAAGYRVITWDTRGFGCSTFRTGVHGQAAIVGDLAAVLDAAEVTRAQFVGQSLGGWSVTAFTLAHPERVQSATLTNTVGGLYTAALLEHLRTVTGLPALSPDLAHRDPARAFLYEQLASFQSPPMTEIASCLRERVDPALMSGPTNSTRLCCRSSSAIPVRRSREAMKPCRRASRSRQVGRSRCALRCRRRRSSGRAGRSNLRPPRPRPRSERGTARSSRR